MCSLGVRYGVLSNYEYTWFVKLVKNESGESGILVTDYFSTVPEAVDPNDNLTKNSEGWSLSQALLWFCKWVAEDENRMLNDGDWKVMQKEMLSARERRSEMREKARRKEQKDAARRANAGTKRRSKRFAKRDEEDDEEGDDEEEDAELFPMDTIDGILDVSRDKIVPILGGGGHGYKGQWFEGVPSLCFAKIVNTALCEEEVLEEMHHEEKFTASCFTSVVAPYLDWFLLEIWNRHASR